MECPYCGQGLSEKDIRSLWSQLCNKLRWSKQKPAAEPLQKTSENVPQNFGSPAASTEKAVPLSEKLRQLREDKV